MDDAVQDPDTRTHIHCKLWSPLNSFKDACLSCQSGMWLQHTRTQIGDVVIVDCLASARPIAHTFLISRMVIYVGWPSANSLLLRGPHLLNITLCSKQMRSIYVVVCYGSRTPAVLVMRILAIQMPLPNHSSLASNHDHPHRLGDAHSYSSDH